ncbi:MAG: M14 family metallopeptidase [Gammaproteobacteria bacterium]
MTIAESSGFTKTGRIEEVERLCGDFARHWPDAVRSFDYGRSAEGRLLRALLVTRAGAMTPAEIRERKVPVLMVQAGIHPGESDGKDAGFIALREMLSGSPCSAALEHTAILFVPAFNTDGHERFGRWNRPNQNGPEEMGWRTTAQNINLNRDYTKADTPEMRAMLRLISEWDPLVCADLHVTDGADFQPDISIQVEPLNQGDPSLRSAGRELRDGLVEHLNAQGCLALDFYPDLAVTDDPSSGFSVTVYSPRFSTGYFPQRNRFTVLVETHSWKPYAKRVHAMKNAVLDLSERVATRGNEWRKLAMRADDDASSLAGTELTVDYTSGWRETVKVGEAALNPDANAAARMIDFKGYAYTRMPSPISGTLVTKYDPKTPQIWHVPLRDQVNSALNVTVTKGGFIVPVAFAAEISSRLAAHGIQFDVVRERKNGIAARMFRATTVTFSSGPFEGRLRSTLHGAWVEQQSDIPEGSLYIPVKQPLARLIVALLEPQAPDSFASWGFFNACFEQKEQMEPYVAEIAAAGILSRNPAIAAALTKRTQDDAGFAGDPTARLQFVLRHHESWDARYNVYPVLRVETPLPEGAPPCVCG